LLTAAPVAVMQCLDSGPQSEQALAEVLAAKELCEREDCVGLVEALLDELHHLGLVEPDL
jgi:hypothetical protein